MQVLNVQDIPGCFNIALVVSRYHRDITQKLLDGALARLKERGFSNDRITIIWVPGAVEIPLAAQRMAQSGKYEAIICFGAVIFGETRHFDYVCDQVSQGCQQVALTQDIPVIFGVLTTNNLLQAEARAGGEKGHVGREAVDAAYELVSVLRQI
jgi:6,7-dimethyl-8-ribityllumazine synthase